eukprot:3130250-Karenia_brevis.AAC.1
MRPRGKMTRDENSGGSPQRHHHMYICLYENCFLQASSLDFWDPTFFMFAEMFVFVFGRLFVNGVRERMFVNAVRGSPKLESNKGSGWTEPSPCGVEN